LFRRDTGLDAEEVELLHNHHNFGWREVHDAREVVVVRTGATPAFPGQKGSPAGTGPTGATRATHIPLSASRCSCDLCSTMRPWSTTSEFMRPTVDNRCAMTIAVRSAICIQSTSWSASLSESNELVASSRIRIGDGVQPGMDDRPDDCCSGRSEDAVGERAAARNMVGIKESA